MQVEIALTEQFEIVFACPLGSPEPGTPWSDLDRVTIAASGTDSLRDVMRRACEAFEVTVTAMAQEAHASNQAEQGETPRPVDAADLLVWAAFRRDDDDQVVADGEYTALQRDTRLRTDLFVVRDSAGRAVWRRPGLDASMSELIDADSHGLVAGDPLQAYLVPSIPQGDPGMLGEWHSFAEALRVLWDVARDAATVGGVAGLAELLRRIVRRRSDTVPASVETNSSSWAERGAAPVDLFRFLISTDWTSDEIAALLGCPAAEAEALLWGLGFVHEPSSDLWIYRGDAVGRLLGDDVDYCFADVFQGADGRQRLRDFAADRLAEFLETGEAPSKEATQQDLAKRRDQWLDDFDVD